MEDIKEIVEKLLKNQNLKQYRFIASNVLEANKKRIITLGSTGIGSNVEFDFFLIDKNKESDLVTQEIIKNRKYKKYNDLIISDNSRYALVDISLENRNFIAKQLLKNTPETETYTLLGTKNDFKSTSPDSFAIFAKDKDGVEKKYNVSLQNDNSNPDITNSNLIKYVATVDEKSTPKEKDTPPKKEYTLPKKENALWKFLTTISSTFKLIKSNLLTQVKKIFSVFKGSKKEKSEQATEITSNTKEVFDSSTVKQESNEQSVNTTKSQSQNPPPTKQSEYRNLLESEQGSKNTITK